MSRTARYASNAPDAVRACTSQGMAGSIREPDGETRSDGRRGGRGGWRPLSIHSRLMRPHFALLALPLLVTMLSAEPFPWGDRLVYHDVKTDASHGIVPWFDP